jgi:hypothetical protein
VQQGYVGCLTPQSLSIVCVEDNDSFWWFPKPPTKMDKDCIHYEQQKSKIFCYNLTNPQLVRTGRNNSNPQLTKVGKHRERMASPEV